MYKKQGTFNIYLCLVSKHGSIYTFCVQDAVGILCRNSEPVYPYKQLELVAMSDYLKPFLSALIISRSGLWSWVYPGISMYKCIIFIKIKRCSSKFHDQTLYHRLIRAIEIAINLGMIAQSILNNIISNENSWQSENNYFLLLLITRRTISVN